MTRDEILKMGAGREMDALVAEKVMGWSVEEATGYWLDDEQYIAYSSPLDFSTSIDDAWKVVEKMQDIDLYILIADGYHHVGWHIELCNKFGETLANIRDCETVSLAICRAALLVVMDIKE